MINVALVGYGYWGPNLARNFHKVDGFNLKYICEIDPKEAQRAASEYPTTEVIQDFKAVLADNTVDLVAIATPVATHYELAKNSILAGKDVFVEKPLADSAKRGAELVDLARKHGRILAVDHTFLFTGAVRKIRSLVESGELGEVRYFDAVRVNLGLFQNDSNVMSDLGPHDISILEFLFQTSPIACQALGHRLGGTPFEDVTYLHLEYENGMIAHFHWNWLAPVKIRKTLICGARKMIVYDDLETTEKVKIYDKGIELISDAKTKQRLLVDYRIGDMMAPKLDSKEALASQMEHLLDCIRERKAPLSDGILGLRVLKILDAAQTSLKSGGKRVEIDL